MYPAKLIANEGHLQVFAQIVDHILAKKNNKIDFFIFVFSKLLAYFLLSYQVANLNRSGFIMFANGFGLCVRAGFGAQNCLPALNLNRSTRLQVYTSPRLTQNPCVCPA